MAHSLGPWACISPLILSASGSIAIMTSGRTDALFELLTDDAAAFDVQTANARLIAAAPELLAALKATLDTYVSLAQSGDCGFWKPEEEPFVIAARAAIAKAEGR